MMKSSGSILRGHLRPMGARSPPFLLVGLFVILGILGFNYWNLSYEYDAIIKEIAELQDHLRIAVLKKENADKQSEALEKRFREAEEQLGKMKITNDQRQKEMKELQNKFEEKNNELIVIKSQLENCHLANSKLNSTQEIADNLQKKVLQLESEKSDLNEANHRLTVERQDMRVKLEELQVRLATLSMMEQQNDMMRIPAAAASGMNVTEAIDQGVPQLHLGVPRTNGSKNVKQGIRDIDNGGSIAKRNREPQNQSQPEPPTKMDKGNKTAVGDKQEEKVLLLEQPTGGPEDDDNEPAKRKDDEQSIDKTEDKNDPNLITAPSKDQAADETVVPLLDAGGAGVGANVETNDIGSQEKMDSNVKDKDSQQIPTNGTMAGNSAKLVKEGIDGKQIDRAMEYDGKDNYNDIPLPQNDKIPAGGNDPEIIKDEGVGGILKKPKYEGNELPPPPVPEPANVLGDPDKASKFEEIKWQPREVAEKPRWRNL